MPTELLPKLLSAAVRFPDAEAIVTPRQSYSYADLVNMICQCVEHLGQQGFDSGERIAIIAHNDIREIILLYALWQLRDVPVLLSHRFPAQLVGEYIGELGCTKFICDSQNTTDCQSTGVPVCDLNEVVTLDVGVGIAGHLVDCQPDNRPATVTLTSGSSGRHKAVVHSLANHVYNALGSNANLPLKPGDRWLLSLSLNHVGGLAILFRTVLSGAAVVVPDHGMDLHESIESLRPTHISLVATQLKRLLSRPLSELTYSYIKNILVGGGPISPGLLENARNSGLPVLATYGSTEMASQVATGNPYDDDQPTSTCGRILKYRDLKISTEGEILVRGQALCLGYLNDSVVQSVTDDNGWFHTGDLGQLDHDGYLTVLGRKDDMFISGGENIYPAQIEAALQTHAEIEDVVVFGMADEKFGHRPAAIVKLESASGMDHNSLDRFLSGCLPSYMLPIRYLVWPQEQGAKPNRTVLAQLAVKGELKEII